MIAAYKNLQTNWIKQSAVDRTDRYYQDLRDTVARKEILRRGPEGALYWATICSHYPEGLQAAYGPEVVLRFYVNIDTYLSVEPPRLPDGVRHPKHDKLLESNAFDGGGVVYKLNRFKGPGRGGKKGGPGRSGRYYFSLAQS